MEACGGAVSPAAREELMRIKAGRSAGRQFCIEEGNRAPVDKATQPRPEVVVIVARLASELRREREENRDLSHPRECVFVCLPEQ